MRRCIVVLAWWGVACSGTGQDATTTDLASAATDTGGGLAEVQAADAAIELDTVAVEQDAGADLGEPDVPAPISGAAGAPCATAADCDSGWCIETPAGQKCAALCQGACPDGFQCAQTTGGDLSSICVPAHPRLCEPCQSDSDCSNTLGGSGSRCVPYQGSGGALLGAFCATPCGSGCPGGYACQSSTSVGGVNGQVCVRSDLACPCDARAVADKLATACAVSNAAGTCKGLRTCSEAGLSPCSAATAASETCNQLDDDCDGLSDEPGGGMCDDGQACTLDACQAGTCIHGGLPGACDDGSACTSGDTCKDGACVGTPLDCDDGKPCTADACDKGCVHLPATGTPCEDGNVCTLDDSCDEVGDCLPGMNLAECTDGNACTADACDAKQGCQHTFAVGACSDGNACTKGDNCDGGKCVGDTVSCDDGNPCTDDGCATLTGCKYAAAVGGCDDGNACTLGDSCQGGVCKGAAAQVCDDGNPCTNDACLSATGCNYLPAIDKCSDGNACTAGDTCSKGGCAPGGPVDCNDGNPCTDDSCEPTKGCQHLANSGECSDGSACTAGEACANGKCAGGAAIDCSDGNVCTDDGCNAKTGCTYGLNTAACDDGNGCTSDDACANGKCAGAGLGTCESENPCTLAACEPVVGCVVKALPIGSKCGTMGTCQAGATCACPSGYKGDGVNCAEIDECAKNNGGCSVNATCENAIGSFKCICKAGFAGDGKTCNLATSGSGIDGALTVNNGQTVTLGAVRTTLNGAAGQTTATLGNGSGFAAGQMVILHQSQGANAGNYEVHAVAGLVGNTLTLAAPLKHSYSSAGPNRAQVMVMPQYTEVLVNDGGVLTGPAWDGATGGILAFAATGTVTVAGSVHMNGRGYRSWVSRGCGTHCAVGANGEGTAGPPVYNVGASNGNGGGGGRQGQDCGNGAGGGHAQKGGDAGSGASGACGGGTAAVPGGAVVGVESLEETANFGGAGGEGGYDEDGGLAGAGGNGGGFVLVQATAVSVAGSGAIDANGAAGGSGNNQCGTGCGMSGGGGGAGGSIRLVVDKAAIGDQRIKSVGNSGGSCTCGGGGSPGAGGRVSIKASSVTGTSAPAFWKE